MDAFVLLVNVCEMKWLLIIFWVNFFIHIQIIEILRPCFVNFHLVLHNFSFKIFDFSLIKMQIPKHWAIPTFVVLVQYHQTLIWVLHKYFSIILQNQSSSMFRLWTFLCKVLIVIDIMLNGPDAYAFMSIYFSFRNNLFAAYCDFLRTKQYCWDYKICL